MNKYFVSVLFVLLVLIGGAFAATTINTLENPVLQGQSWEIKLNCPNMVGPADECLVEWSGPEDGNFIESDNNPDPDKVNKFQVLDLPGDYNYTIKKCPTGPGSCGAIKDSFTITVNPAADSSPSTGTLWLRYRSVGPNMRLSGIAPTGATSIQIYVFDENNSSQVVPASSVTVDENNNNYYWKNVNLSSVTPQTLNVRAVFRDVNNSLIYTATGVLEALKLDAMQSEINQLEVDVYDLNTEINNQDSRLNVLEQQAADLNAQDATFAAQIVVINQRLAEHDQNIIDLQAQVSTVDQRVTDLNAEMQAEISALNQRIDDINGRLTTVEANVALMNVGTINYTFNKNLNYGLVVKGKIPLGATSGKVSVKNSATGTLLYNESITVNFSQNTYSKSIKVSDLENDILTIQVSFKGFGTNSYRYTLWTSFVETLLLDMNDRVVQLEADVNALDANVAALHAQDANFAAQINVINQRLADHDQNIIDLQNDINDVNTALNLRIDDVNADLISEVARLDALIIALDVRLTALEATVDSMNHGTINLLFDQSAMTIDVWGEAPIGATQANAYAYNADGTGSISLGTDAPDTNNAYNFTGIDVSAWAPAIYSIEIEHSARVKSHDFSCGSRERAVGFLF